MIKFILLSIALIFIYEHFTQKKLLIKFTYQYANKNDSNNIKLIVENTSSTKTFFYSIGVGALTDTGWVGLIADINSIGQNGFLSLKPIRYKSTAIKNVSKKQILFIYSYYKPKKIRFNVIYYEKKDFESKGEIIYSMPIPI